MTTREIMKGLRSGETDLIEYLEGICDRVVAEDPKIHAMVPHTFDRENVLSDASRLLAQYPDPSSRPPLFGVPVGVKDIFRVWGFLTRCGTDLPPEVFQGTEATCVSKLVRAGAIILGKTVTTEFAYYEPGPTRNPHNVEHTPGGSSSGSAAGVASGLFPFSLGTQTVGSVIRPAAFCGVVGFKPSFDRVSISGVIPFSPSADQVGIFSEDLSGVGLFMSVFAEDWVCAPENGSALEGLCLGVPDGPYLDQASKHGREYFEHKLVDLQKAGWQIKRLPALQNIETVNENHRRLIAGEMARVHARWYEQYGHLYRPMTVEIIELGKSIRDEELDRLASLQLRFREEMDLQMKSEGIDCWVCPSATDHAPKGLGSTGDPVMNLPWTHAGLPVLTIPAGKDEGGLPHGVQLVARFNRDENLIAKALEFHNARTN